MPLNQPTRKFNTAINAMARPLWSGPIHCTGTIMNIMETAAKTSPSGRKRRALLRSDTLAMMNLEKP